jgi:hypothetical protein
MTARINYAWRQAIAEAPICLPQWMGIPVGDLPPRGTGMGKKCSPQVFVGIPAGKFFRHEDRDGELFPDGEFFVAIPTPAHDLRAPLGADHS